MHWDEDLLDEQKIAASHSGGHSCLLAGPGTGKTLTLQRHVAYLIEELEIPSNQILALTFTRAASFELKKRISQILGEDQEIPKVLTLHSFALRQLLQNADNIDSIPRPVRIADDWEENQIVVQDLKDFLGYRVKDVKNYFHLLSADWQQLNADSDTWEQTFPDSRFLGAWRQHRTIYGYTLRDELVYQLKRGLEQSANMNLESNFSHLLVDEYQDLNRCDIAIIFALRERGIEVFAAGDDDQSIYGFRYAYPEGIRRFNEDYVPSTFLGLRTCVRCDRNIIKLAEFIANLDHRRIPKPLISREDAGIGAVHILRFQNQDYESRGISEYCNYLLRVKHLEPDDIIILLRSDRNGIFSSNIRDALARRDIPVAIPTGNSIFETDSGRIFVASIKLLQNGNDSLALRTILELKRNHIGKITIKKIFDFALRVGSTFFDATIRIAENPDLLGRDGYKISRAIREIKDDLEQYQERFLSIDESTDVEEIIAILTELTRNIFTDEEEREKVINYLSLTIHESDPTEYKNLSRILFNTVGDVEQELEIGKINIMTMHKAKGLTASAVIIAACEDEYIPGRQIGDSEGDERRLLYVSLSRAKHYLTITYCDQRTGAQSHSGRNPDDSRRTLTRFLRDAPFRPMNGNEYIDNIRPV